MGIVARQGIKSTIITYVGIIIGTFNVLWLFPKFLSPEEIGLVRLLQDIPMLLAVFLQLGAANVAEKFFFYFKEDEQRKNGFLFLLLIYPLVIFILFVSLFFSFQDFWLSIYETKSPLFIDYFIFILPLAFFMMYSSILEAYCRVHFRIVVPALIREVIVRIFFSFITVFYALKIINLEDLVILFTITYGVTLFMLIGYLKNLGKFFISVNLKFLNKELLKEIGKYMLFIIPGTAGSLIAAKIDTIMLGAMLGLGFTGIYSIAYFIGTVVEIPRRSLSQISIPVVSQAWKDNDIGKIDLMYKKTALNQLIVGALLFLLIWTNVDEILNLIPNSENYRMGKYVIFYIALSRLIDMAAGINGEIILYSRYYRFNLISILFLGLITIIANLIFIPLMGIEGAAFAYAQTIVLYNLMKALFLWGKFKIQPFMKNTFWVIVSAMVAYLPASLISAPSETDFLTSLFFIFIKSIVIIVIFIGLVLFFRLSEDVSTIVNGAMKKIKMNRN